MSNKLKKNEKKKRKILKSISKLKNKLGAKEKKLSKLNIKIASIEKKIADKKAKKLANKKTETTSVSVNN